MRKLSTRPSLVLLVAWCVTGAAVGQAFNIDIEDTDTNPLGDLPPPAYGGAPPAPGMRAQAGEWWGYDPNNPTNTFAMDDIYGDVTGVTIISDNPFANPNWTVWSCSPTLPSLAPDTELMCDVAVQSFEERRFEIVGLLPGAYRVLTYGFPAVGSQNVRVTTPTSPFMPAQPVGLALPGTYPGLVLGQTYANHAIDVALGENVLIRVSPQAAGQVVRVAGIQIVPMPIGTYTSFQRQAFNSVGLQARLTAHGSGSMSGAPNDTWFQVSQVPPNAYTILIAADDGVATPGPAACPLDGFEFITGTQVLVGMGMPASVGGSLRIDADLGALGPAGLMVPDLVYFQAYYRDLPGTFCGPPLQRVSTLLTNSVEINVTP